jgi:integrase
MAGMPRPRPPYLHRYRTRHGKFIWYVRKPRGRRIRIHGEFGTEAFNAEYRAAIADAPKVSIPSRAKSGSLQWLWERYCETDKWAKLSPASRRQRENIMAHVLKSGGHEPFVAINVSTMEEGLARRAATPAQARKFLDAMRALFGWAAKAKLIEANPTAGLKVSRPQNDGIPVWTEDDVDRYEARWPIGTKERVWFDVLAYTGLRRGDAVRLGRQHVRDGVATIRTEKSQETMTVTLPILPILATTLAAGPCGDLAFICGANGKPLTKESFGNLFRAACRAAGVDKSAHGLRKVAATRAAENGATVHQLMAIFGWETTQMAEIYTRKANRSKLAREAMHTLSRTVGEQSMCQPGGKVGTPDEISK